VVISREKDTLARRDDVVSVLVAYIHTTAIRPRRRAPFQSFLQKHQDTPLSRTARRARSPRRPVKNSASRSNRSRSASTSRRPRALRRRRAASPLDIHPPIDARRRPRVSPREASPLPRPPSPPCPPRPPPLARIRRARRAVEDRDGCPVPTDEVQSRDECARARTIRRRRRPRARGRRTTDDRSRARRSRRRVGRRRACARASSSGDARRARRSSVALLRGEDVGGREGENDVAGVGDVEPLVGDG